MPSRTFANLPEAKRERLVDAILDELAEHAYVDASLDRIAKAGGVSKGSLYQYFDDKLDLYRYAVTEALPRRKAAFVEAAPPGSDLFDQLAHGVRTGLTTARHAPALVRLGLRLVAPAASGDLQELHGQVAQQRQEGLLALVHAASERGELRPDVDPHLAAHLIDSFLGQGLLDAVLQHVGTDLAHLADDPTRLDAIDPAEVDALVEQAAACLRRAIGVSGSSPS